MDEQWEPGAREVRESALEIGAIDGGEAVAAGIDEEALEAGDASEGEGLEVMLIAIDAAAPEGVVDRALGRAVGTARRCGLALELEGGDGGGLGETVQRHVDDGGEAAGGCGAGGGGEAFPLGAAGLVDVSVDVDEAGKQGERAEIFHRNVGGDLGDGLDGGDVLGVDEDRGILFAMRRDDAAATESVYHVADYLPFPGWAKMPDKQRLEAP